MRGLQAQQRFGPTPWFQEHYTPATNALQRRVFVVRCSSVQIFMIFAVPLGYVYYLTLRDEAGQPSQVVGRPLAKGLLFGLLVALLMVLVRRLADPAQHGAGLFWYLGFHDYFVPAIALFGLYLVSTPDLQGVPPAERRTGLVSLLAGGFTALSILDLFARADYLGPYELFQLPALRVALIVLLPTLYYQFCDDTFWTRFLFLAALLAFPFAAGVVGLVTSAGFPVLSTVLSLVILAASFVGSILVGGSKRSAVFW